ncbi:MAG: hypothetical protein QM487_01765 [Candidatus Marithrix sp.]
MKKYLFMFIFYTIPSYAMPPYFGISVGTNLSFQNSTCVTAAKKTLSKNGFKNIVQYKNSSTVFAAYRKTSPYQYKALVKCLADSGVLIVVAVADVPKNAKNKADILRQKIQQYNGINSSSTSTQSIYTTQSVTGTRSNKAKGNTSADWDNSLMGKKECMANAERSLRRSGFYKSLNYDENSVYANNKHNYKAVIRCLTDNKEVYYEVTGGTKSIRDNLVEDLKKDFY